MPEMLLPWMGIQSDTSARGIRGASSVPAARSVAQPAEAVQRLQPAAVLDLDLEGRAAAGLDQMAGQRKAAVIDFQRDLRVGEAQIRRRDQHALGRAAGIAPTIDGPGAQTPARLAPHLLCDERPETRRAARRSCQKNSLPLSRANPAAPAPDASENSLVDSEVYTRVNFR